MPSLGTSEILIIALVVVLLFGATKLPKMARSLGQSARVFKAEARGMKEDDAAAKQQQDSDPQQLTSGEQSNATFNPSGSQQTTQKQNSQQNDSQS